MAQTLKSKITAIRIASIHESYFDMTGDRCRDDYNNVIGADLGNPVTSGTVSCSSACEKALDGGFLQTEEGCGGFEGPNCPESPNG